MPFFCYNKNDYCDHSENCDNCEVWVFGKGGKEVPTNADRIRAMSDVSLAEELVFYRPMQNDFETHVGYFAKWTDALKAELKWLQQPADKGE